MTETTVRLFNDEDDVREFLQAAFVQSQFKNPTELLFLADDEPLKAHRELAGSLRRWSGKPLTAADIKVTHVSHQKAGEDWASGWGFPFDDTFVLTVRGQQIKLNIRSYSDGEFVQYVGITL